MPAPFIRTRLLILCKTYPSPSSGYVETSCIAAMTAAGQLIRLYPVPFRLLDDAARFKKWPWVDADIAKATNDQRPESYRVRADTLQPIDEPLSTRHNWADRQFWLEKLEQQLPSNDLMLLMVAIHRFPDQWLIVSLICPPREQNLRLL